jgi:hypothetical protein
MATTAPTTGEPAGSRRARRLTRGMEFDVSLSTGLVFGPDRSIIFPSEGGGYGH